MADGSRMDASYVLDWLRQTAAPENVIGLQEKVVEAVGGYVSAEDRSGLREVFRSMERSGHIRRVDGEVLQPGRRVKIVSSGHPWYGRCGTIRSPLGGDADTATWEVVLENGPSVSARGYELEAAK